MCLQATQQLVMAAAHYQNKLDLQWYVMMTVARSYAEGDMLML